MIELDLLAEGHYVSQSQRWRFDVDFALRFGRLRFNCCKL